MENMLLDKFDVFTHILPNGKTHNLKKGRDFD
mgnify:FL=1